MNSLKIIEFTICSFYIIYLRYSSKPFLLSIISYSVFLTIKVVYVYFGSNGIVSPKYSLNL